MTFNFNQIREFMNSHQSVATYVGIVFLLVLVHSISTHLYHQYCVISYSNFYNLIFFSSPFCSYSLEIIQICHSSLTKMCYIFGGYLVLHITNLFHEFNIFAKYFKKPLEDSTSPTSTPDSSPSSFPTSPAPTTPVSIRSNKTPPAPMKPSTRSSSGSNLVSELNFSTI